MASPENFLPPESHDEDDFFTESEKLDIDMENLRAQSDILKALFFHPSMLSAEDIETVIRYAHLAGQDAEQRYRADLRANPDVRAWNQLEQFILDELPTVFEQNPQLFLVYGVDPVVALQTFHDSLLSSKRNKQIFLEETHNYQTSEQMIYEKQVSPKNLGKETYLSLLEESIDLSKQLHTLFDKHGLSKSTPSHILEEELKTVSPELARHLLNISDQLSDVRMRYNAIHSWEEGLLYEVSTADITREYIVALFEKFAVLPKDVDAFDLLMRIKQDLLLKTTGVTKSITPMTTQHTVPVPTKLPGNTSIQVFHMNTGDERSSRFQLKINQKKRKSE